MAGNAIVKISRRVKQIRKAHPSMTFRAAQKQASREYNAGKLGRVSGTKKKSAASNKTRKKSVSGRRKVSGVRKSRPRTKRNAPAKRVSGMGTIGAINSTLRSQRKALEDRLGKQLVSQYKATTARSRKKIAKNVKETKAKIRTVTKAISQ
jgi:hypothetical protein